MTEFSGKARRLRSSLAVSAVVMIATLMLMPSFQTDARRRMLVVAAIPGIGFGLVNYIQNVIAAPPDRVALLYGGPVLFIACFLVASLAIGIGHVLLSWTLRRQIPTVRIAGLQVAYFLLVSFAVFAALALATTAFRHPDRFGPAFGPLYREIFVTCLPVWAVVYAVCLFVLWWLDREAENTRREPSSGRLAVMAGHRLESVALAEISYLQAQGNYVDIVTPDRRITVRKPLGTIESELPARDYVRIHRSFVVRKDAIRSLQRSGSGRTLVELNDGICLPVGRKRLEQTRTALGRANPTFSHT